MTSFVEIPIVDPITVDENINRVNKHTSSSGCSNPSRHKPRHVLKSKEKNNKLKCKRLLKKKLKKYKLRQDGSEDQEVLDVSTTLVSSLVIKSPNNSNHLTEVYDHFDLRPKNYLFNMGRRKGAIHTANREKNIAMHFEQTELVDTPDTSKERKHTNAFQLLMDSRNKSIGCNSPGKEKNYSQYENEDLLEKNNIKVKRKLLLEKMAVAKGHLKNKEMEDLQDKIIKKKMDKRANRLKNMILQEAKPAKLNLTNDKEPVTSKLVHEKNETENYDSSKPIKNSKGFKLVDIFKTLNDPVCTNPVKSPLLQEDKEFLQKLSPSLRKKESMLSYFKKVDKEPESLGDSDNDNIIKVKLQVKSKKKVKKSKLSLKKHIVPVDNVNDENNEITSKTVEISETSYKCNEHVVSKNVGGKHKNKQKLNMNGACNSEPVVENNEGRPKRSVKRPVKYTDDVCVLSSDEELHIFTPKKKKCSRNSVEKVISNIKSEPLPPVQEQVKPVKKKVKEVTNTTKKPVKLAPIFVGKQLDTAALEAKQKFLQSGVPEQLKKVIQQQKISNAISSEFPVVLHVQQLQSDIGKLIQLIPTVSDASFEEIRLDNLPNIEKEELKKLLNLDKASREFNVDNNTNVQTVLESIKQRHPKFPVYRTYRYFRGKRKEENNCEDEFCNSIEVTREECNIINEGPDTLNWTEKYKSMSTKQIIGNFESIKELKKWLISWSENQIKSKSRGYAGSDSSDYYQSDTESRDSLKSMNNLLVVTGPTGCGKTSSIYAVAAELAIKVIEVNASSKRTGKIMLQDFQEATQSHKVNRSTSNTDNSQKSQENCLTEKLRMKKMKGRPKKVIETAVKKSSDKHEVSTLTPLSQDGTRTGMSLILIDDADIIFEQDDGFTSAIVQLVQCSKRPVILITSSLACPHLQRFLVNGKILKMYPLLPRMLGTWLDIMCLADSGVSSPGLGAKMLDYFRGDIRKTVNYLQFHMSSSRILTSDEETDSQNIDYRKINTDDENSNMSWADHENCEDMKLITANNNVEIDSNSMWNEFNDRHLNLLTLGHPMQLFNIWWSVPKLLDCTPIEVCPTKNFPKPKRTVSKGLDSIADVLDAISLSDCINHSSSSSLDITAWPWCSPELDSVSEQDNVDYYVKTNELSDELCHTLVTGYINKAQDVLNSDRRTEISFPGTAIHRERNKIVSRHKSLTTYLNPWATLDRRSLALDYWSSCRNICRIEKSKSDNQISVKRNNRFCHYMKSLGVLCKSEAFDNLCDSLSDQGTELKIFNYN